MMNEKRRYNVGECIVIKCGDNVDAYCSCGDVWYPTLNDLFGFIEEHVECERMRERVGDEVRELKRQNAGFRKQNAELSDMLAASDAKLKRVLEQQSNLRVRNLSRGGPVALLVDNDWWE